MRRQARDSDGQDIATRLRHVGRKGTLTTAVTPALLLIALSGCGGSNDGVDLVLRAQCINGVQSSCQAIGLPPQDTTVYGAGAGVATEGSATALTGATAPATTAPTK